MVEATEPPRLGHHAKAKQISGRAFCKEGPQLSCLSTVGPLFCAALVAKRYTGDQTESAKQLHGKVVFPDGTPAAEATVRATTVCNDDPSYDVHISHSQERTTAEDGTFSFPVFDPDCNRYRFTANKQADYWLPSDISVFTGVPPIVSIIEFSSSAPSQPVHIVLGIRGGKLEIRVWDVATNRFIRAGLYIDRKPVAGKHFGSVQTETGTDGSAITELVPPGEYTVTVMSYLCGKDEYWTSNGPVSSFVVGSGTLLKETIRIDVRNIKPRRDTMAPDVHTVAPEICKLP